MKVIKIEQHSEAERFMSYFDNGWQKRTFNEIVEKFPNYITEIKEDDRPSWGSAYYVCDSNGMPKLHSQNWDTSG